MGYQSGLLARISVIQFWVLGPFTPSTPAPFTVVEKDFFSNFLYILTLGTMHWWVLVGVNWWHYINANNFFRSLFKLFLVSFPAFSYRILSFSFPSILQYTYLFKLLFLSLYRPLNIYSFTHVKKIRQKIRLKSISWKKIPKKWFFFIESDFCQSYNRFFIMNQLESVKEIDIEEITIQLIIYGHLQSVFVYVMIRSTILGPLRWPYTAPYFSTWVGLPIWIAKTLLKIS